MSLVAALAVAGLSQTASAGSLEEAIKGVSISGKMEVEYDYSNTNDGDAATNEDTTDNTWDLDWDVTAKIPVNDMVTAVFGMQGDNEVDVQETASDEINDQSPTVTKLYFQYANGPVTAIVGKQGIGAPWFDDERANGVKALYNAGPVTLAAAHFTGANAKPIVGDDFGAQTDLQTLFEKTQITAVAAIGSIGPVNAQLWYASLSGITDDTVDQTSATSYALIADATFDIVNVGLKYAEADYKTDNATAGQYNVLDDDAEMLQLSASANFGVAIPYIAYGATDSKQGGAGLDLTHDTDSTLDFGSEQLSIDDMDNAEAIAIGVTVPMGAWKFDISYVDGEYDDYLVADKDSGVAYSADFSEFLVQADYKMSKNFTIGAHYSDAEVEDQSTATVKNTQELKAASVSLEYKF
jgi:hypothetical protein